MNRIALLAVAASVAFASLAPAARAEEDDTAVENEEAPVLHKVDDEAPETRRPAPRGRQNPPPANNNQANVTCDSPATPVIPGVPDTVGGHPNCHFYGTEEVACGSCLAFWGSRGREKNNHFCKDKSRSARAPIAPGHYCYNWVEDTSHGYECYAYCPPNTPTCKENCNQVKRDGSPCHDHPLRVTRNKHSGRLLGPPGFAPRKNEGKEERAKCNW